MQGLSSKFFRVKIVPTIAFLRFDIMEKEVIA